MKHGRRQVEAGRDRRDFRPRGQIRLGSLREYLVNQGQHGNEQQTDERPDHLVQGVHLRPEPGDLNLETIDLRLHFSPEISDLSLQLRPELGDLNLETN